MKVIIVDDSELMQERVAAVIDGLKDAKLVGLAKNSLETYELVEKMKPDLIILDIRLPGQNGMHILETLKKADNTLKFIILSNYPYPQYKKRCLELGADYFLDKTNEFEQLQDVLKKLVILQKAK